MKAMILCAGLGTRLRPWTLSHPKALVPIGGVPMLKRVSDRLVKSGFDSLTVNVHHFASQIVDYIESGALSTEKVSISDESQCLLDTGGGILNAKQFLSADESPFLVHNVDILSDADLQTLYDSHVSLGNDVTLLVSDRESSRRLVFDKANVLKGWINKSTGETRPADLKIDNNDEDFAFSGIYVMSPCVFDKMLAHGLSGRFPIMDFFLGHYQDVKIGAVIQPGLRLIDIGKPDTLSLADSIF